MRGSVYINRVNGNPEQVTMSPSASPSALLSRDSAHGWLFDKVLQQLRIESDVRFSERDKRHVMLAEGTTEEVINGAEALRSAIGGIVLGLRRNFELEDIYPSEISRMLGKISTKTLPALEKGIPFDRLFGQVIVRPIADDTNKDDVNVFYGPRPTQLQDAIEYLEYKDVLKGVGEKLAPAWLRSEGVTPQILEAFLAFESRKLLYEIFPGMAGPKAQKEHLSAMAKELQAILDPYKGVTIAMD